MNRINIRSKKHNMGRCIGVAICILLVATFLTASLDATGVNTTGNNCLSYSFTFIEPGLQTTYVDSSQYTTLYMSGCIAIGKYAGAPMLPVKSVKLLLPAMTTVMSVTVTGASVELAGIESPIYPYQNPVPFGFEPEEFQFNTELYASDSLYPSDVHDGYHIGYCRGYAILDITLNPVQYIPKEGRLFYYPELTVTVDLEETGHVNQFFRNDLEDKAWVEMLVYNPEVTDTYATKLPSFKCSGGLCDPSDNYDYVIITTTYNGLDYWEANGSIPYNWESLMDKHEQDDGLRCNLVTIQDINACPDYYNDTPLFNDTEAHIREFCKDAYEDWGTSYIFVGGDDEWIPARHMKYAYESNVDSDIYWSNLDNTFNEDHDVYWGEEGDLGFDLYSELFIGRITCDEPQDVSNWMTKSFYYADAWNIDYLENAAFYGGETGWSCSGDDFIDYSAIKGTDNWLGPIPGAHGSYPSWLGFNYGFETWNAVNPDTEYNLSVKWTGDSSPNPGWQGGSESVAIAEFKNAINNDQVTLISGIAHANADMSLDVGMSSWESDYHNTKPFFIHDFGCHCGDMDASDDGVLHSMLFHSDTELAFACVYNTCFGWGSRYDTNSSSALQQKLFWDYLFDTFNNSGSTMNWQMGKAMAYSKDSMASTINWSYSGAPGSWRGVIQGCLLFGDPAQRIKPSTMFEHNVGIQTLDIDASNPVKPNKIIRVNATIYNNGENNETNVNVSFRVNGSHENSTNISLFESQTTQQVSFNWTPSVGSYIVTINVTIPGVTEGSYSDNEKNTTVIVGIQNIDTNELFNTIQEAINDSDTLDGHSILVPSGTYQENIMINKNLSLLGVNRDTTIIKSNESLDSVIQIQNMNSVNITQLTIKDETYGVYIESSSNIIITDITVFNNTAIGIYLNLSQNISLTNNEISNNTVGINMTKSSNNNALTENDIMNNTKGLTIDSESNNNSIYHNNFNNTQNAIDDGNNNSWDNGYLDGFHICGGNWWSDYNGSDEFSGPGQDVQGSDGIGDTPYDIAGEGNSQDWYPLMEPWDGLSPGTIFVDDDNTEGPWDGTPEHPYQYIQNGVDDATVEGDIVFVYNGTYNEQVTLVRQQKIGVIGENKETTIINATGYGNDAVIITGTSKGVNISGFTIKSDNGRGIYIYNSYYNTIFGNNIINNNHGVYLWSSSNNNITGNTITNNNRGIYLYNSSNNNVINCDVYNNSYGGIRLYSFSSNNNVINCDVYNNSYGIHLISYSNNNIITENTFTNNNYGVFIESLIGDSDDNKIYHNNFINNNGDIQAYDECDNIWNDSYPSGGNYWNDYNGSDMFSGPGQNISGSDGMGDIPYNISGGDNQDKYPLMIPWIPPEITNVSNTPDTVGFGCNVTIMANVNLLGNTSDIDTVKVNITYPDNFTGNFTMNNTVNDTYEYNFSDTWLVGQYNYTIWAVDNAGNSNSSSGYSFNVSAQCNISIQTLKDEYGSNEYVNITDPPEGGAGVDNEEQQIGYELLDDNTVLHIWNRYNDYYFNTSSGIQLTNHYNEYWSQNVLMFGYYNNDEWHLIYRTDELSGFNKDIETDNDTYVNATLWKDLSYGDYDFKLAIRYHLSVNDSDLTIIPYIKNLGQAIPYDLAFGWEIKDIQIDASEENNYIDINRSTYLLNQTLNLSFTDLPSDNLNRSGFEIYDSFKYLYLKWNKNLTYKVTVKNRTGQYNAPTTLFIKIGTLGVNQEKYTEIHWLDAQKVYAVDLETNYFVWFDTGTYHNIAPTGVDEGIMQGGTFVRDKWWVCDYFGNIWTVNLITGVKTEVGSSGTGELVGLAYHEISGILYGMSTKNFYEINMNDGSATLIGSMGNPSYMISLDCDSDGNMYAYELDVSNGNFYLINVDTGHATFIGKTGVALMYAQDMAYDYNNDIMYVCAFVIPACQGQLYTVDLATGQFTYIDTLYEGHETSCFAIPYTAAPIQGNHKIWNATTKVEKSLNATNVDLYPTCFNVTISDPQGDKMNITILTNATGPWTVVNQTSGSGLSDGAYSFTNTSWVDARNTKYWISFNVTDGTNWSNKTFHFTTYYIQSKINNTGSTDIKGYLLMQVRYFNETLQQWVVADDTVNETIPKIINSSEELALDQFFNGEVNTNDLSYGSGMYRVYAAFRNPDGDVLVCDDATKMEAWYEFEVDTS